MTKAQENLNNIEDLPLTGPAGSVYTKTECNTLFSGSGDAYTKTESDTNFLGKTAKAADSNLLDGLNSTAFTLTGTAYTKTESNANFLGKTAKAADSNLLDGLNSTTFMQSNWVEVEDGNDLVDIISVSAHGDGIYLVTDITGKLYCFALSTLSDIQIMYDFRVDTAGASPRMIWLTAECSQGLIRLSSEEIRVNGANHNKSYLNMGKVYKLK